MFKFFKKEYFKTTFHITLVVLAFYFILNLFAVPDSFHKLLSPMGNNNALHPLTNSKNTHEVFGFAPYWTIDKLENVDFNILTTFAYFSLDIDNQGNISKDGKGYEVFKSQTATDLFKKAHTYGTRVVATITQMDNNTILAFMDNPEAQVNAINQTVELVDKRGIDGVNVDFEYLGDPGQDYRNKFSNFVQKLTDAMHQKISSSKVTVSVYASSVKDPKIYDIASIGKTSDGIFMMAYDFATTSADNAMPTDPLYGYKNGTYWYDISTAVDDFLTQIPAQKLILGLPWYGYDYLVYQPQINAATRPYWTWKGQPETKTYSLATDQISPASVGSSNYQSGWDSNGQVGWKAYYVAETGTWRMIFIDDVKSMNIKYDFAKKKNLGGVGIWALGFDEGKTELWTLLNQTFGLKFADSSVMQRQIGNSQ